MEQIPKVEVGYAKTANNFSTEIYQVTSGRSFKVETVIITNKSGLANVVLYDAVSSEISSKRLDVMVGASDTVILNKDDLIGVQDFLSSVVAYTSISGVWIHVGGYEY
jgi:hypothetical protein